MNKKRKYLLPLIAFLMISVMVACAKKGEPMTIGADNFGYAVVNGNWIMDENEEGSVFFSDTVSGASVGFIDFGIATDENTLDSTINAFIDTAMGNDMAAKEKVQIEEGLKLGGFDAKKAWVDADGTLSVIWVLVDDESNLHAIVLDVLSNKAGSIATDIESTFSLNKPAA